MNVLLEVKNLYAAYEHSDVIENVSFEVSVGNIVAIIGPNGAGKSTVLKAISGILVAEGGKKTAGKILFKGQDIVKLRADQLVAIGVALVPDGRRVFKSMRVRENLEMGAFLLHDSAQLEHNIEQVLVLFPQLRERLSQKAGTLSSGEQQMLAIGRALMLDPKLLLIDEPSLGLAPRLLDDVFEKLKMIRDDKQIGILIVEQNVHKVLQNADRVIAMNLGKVMYSGRAADLLKDNNELKRIFL